ncbi:MAG: 4-hydroxy-tetrahydrodipicolinate synthase [Muribaculaceae bacterium]|nr:4-hydroxy-tetrahydrodipicolinate synthase [Muribaculaceae bacterium]
MANLKIDGLGVALITPFKEDLFIDYEALGNIIEHIIKGGVDYIVVLGTTAETPTLTLEEKNELAGFVNRKVNGRLPLVLGIGGNNTASVVNDILTRNLEGYSAILSVAPYYNKPTQEGLYLHFASIVEASPLPILLYNVPGRTGVNLSPRTTLRLAALSDKFCGVKEASGDLTQAKEIIDGAPSHFHVLSGNDSDTAALMKVGSSGVISVLANAFPEKMKKIVDLCKEGKFDEAMENQKKLNTLIGSLFEDGNPAGIKAMLHHLGMAENFLRLPLVPVSKNLESKIKKEISLLTDG